jgi:hypothetical protein
VADGDDGRHVQNSPHLAASTADRTPPGLLVFGVSVLSARVDGSGILMGFFPRFGEGHIVDAAIGKVSTNTSESENLCLLGDSKPKNREVALVSIGHEQR